MIDNYFAPLFLDLFQVPYQNSDYHFVEIREASADSDCVYKTIATVCQEQIYTTRIIRVFKTCAFFYYVFASNHQENFVSKVFLLGH